MAKYIECEAYRDLFTEERCLYSCAEIKEFVDAIPAADVQPVKHGKWIVHDDELLGVTTECSVCHVEGCLDGYYCPNCGAKMDGET